MLVEEGLKWLQYANIAGTAFLVWRLAQQNLYKAYRWFFVYLVFDLLQSFVDKVPMGDKASVYRYITGQGIKTALTAFVVLEIYELALAERKALARFGRNLVAYVFAGAFLLSLALLPYSARIKAIQMRQLRYAFLLEGTMDSTFLLFLGLMAVFLLWFPVEIRKNLVVYIVGFAVYFAARWLILVVYVRQTSVLEKNIFNVVSYIVKLVVIGFWLKAMRKDGEIDKTTTGHRWNPEEMNRLKHQLDEINDSLERLSR